MVFCPFYAAQVRTPHASDEG
ncbi:hypothetical protein SPHINGO391_300019 [Sphingomonas aurantiaca]|uniref:Uncharacterized protein n=1 Tax=Sphingomonas aurantiaca TaxID=185949 RepID=A0A5E7XYJ6_9SPHN|nr:hypothetical protein SPHINGO391_300019 [Sphingomonas aurantiaca]